MIFLYSTVKDNYLAEILDYRAYFTGLVAQMVVID